MDSFSTELEKLTEEQKKIETLRDELSLSSVSNNDYNKQVIIISHY